MSTEELLSLRESLVSGLGGLESPEEDPLESLLKEQYAGGNALTRGLSRGVDVAQMGYGSALEGIGKVAGLEGLQQYGGDIVAEQEQELAAKSPYATRLQDVKDAEGILGTTGALASFTGSALGESLPQMGTTLGGSLAGAAAGARAGMVAGLPGAVAGGIAGGLLANVPFFYGMNREAQKEAIEQGYRTEMSEGAAFLASIPQSTMDLISDRLLVGLGPKVGVNVEKLSRQGGLFTRGAKGAALGATVEIPTELGQQLIERYQAGMPIDSPEAIDEYLEVMAAAGLVGGSIRGATNVIGGDPEAKAKKDAAKQAEKAEEDNRRQQELKDSQEQERLERLAKGDVEQLELDVEVDQATPAGVEIKNLQRTLQQFKDGDGKTQYVDPTAGLLPEAAEKEQKLDEIYELKINTPPDADEDTKRAIDDEIAVKNQRIADINERIDAFVKKNGKLIKETRKNNQDRLDAIQAEVLSDDLYGATREDVTAYETAGGEQVSLFDLPIAAKDIPPLPKAPRTFEKGIAEKTGDELVRDGFFTLEDFENPRYKQNISGKPLSVKESGLTPKQLDQVKTNIEADRESEIILEDLSNRTQELIEPPEKGVIDKSPAKAPFNEKIEDFTRRFENNAESKPKLLQDLRQYVNKVESREDAILSEQGEETVQALRQDLFNTMGYALNKNSKRGKNPEKINGKTLEPNATAAQVRRKLKLTSADILTPEYHSKNIDLSKVGVNDLRFIYRKKKEALAKKAKEDAAKKEAADKKARQAEEAQKAKQAEEAQKARQAEEAKGPVKKKKTTAKGPAKKKKTERNAVSRYDALTDEQKNKLEEDTGLSRSKGELIEAILEDEARFNKLIDGIEAGEVTKKKVTKKKVAKKKTTAKKTDKQAKEKAKEEANIKAVKENDSQTKPNEITKNALRTDETSLAKAEGKKSPIALEFVDKNFKLAISGLTSKDFKNIKPKGTGKNKGKYTKKQVDDLIALKDYRKNINNIKGEAVLAPLKIMNNAEKTRFDTESKKRKAGNYGVLQDYTGGEEIAILLLEREMSDSVTQKDINNISKILSKNDGSYVFADLEKSSFGIPLSTAKEVGETGAITEKEYEGKAKDVDEVKRGYPFTGGKYADEFVRSLPNEQQRQIAENIIEEFNLAKEAEKLRSDTTKVTSSDKSTVDEDKLFTRLEEIQKEQAILNDAQREIEAEGKEYSKAKEYKANEIKLDKLSTEALNIETGLGIEGARITKEESQANNLQSKVTELVQKNRELLTSITAIARLKGFGVVKEGLQNAKLELKELQNALKKYINYVNKNKDSLSVRHLNRVANTPSEVDNTLSYLEELSQTFGVSSLERITDGAEDAATAKAKGTYYSVPYESKIYPKTTVEKTKAAILDKFGKAGVNRITVATNPKKAGLDINPTAAGVVIDGKPYLFTDNIAEGNELGVLLHELGVHVGMPAFVGQGNYKFLINKIKQFADANDGSRESELAKRAFNRVREAGKIVDVNKDDELIAYFVEEAVNSGVNPSAELVKKSKLGIWFRRFIAGTKNAVSKLLGTKFKGDFTAQDIVDLAYGGADFAIRTPNMKITNAEKAIQYSVAMPIGSGIEKLNAPFRSINNAMPEWSQNVIDSLLNNVSNLPDYLKKVWYNLLSLRQMADTVDRFGEKYKPIADGIRKLNELVNQRRYNIDEERLRWQSALLDAQSHKEGYSDADLKEFYDIVHESTLEEIDLRSKQSDVTSTDLYKRYMKVVNKSSDLSKYDLRRSYNIMADEYEKAGNRLIDFYRKNATKDQLEKDPETGQDVLKTKVKKELGFVTNAAGRIIPYFPLVREGSWWIDYVAADGDTYTLSYESKRQAEQAAKEIEQDPANKIEYKKGSPIYQRVRNDELNDTANIKILTEVQRALEKALPTGPEKDQAITQLKDTILKSYPSESLKRQFKKRKGTKGFRQDVFQNFAHMGLKFSNELSLLDNVDPLNEAIGALEQFSEGGKAPPAIANILDSIQRRSSFMRNPTPGAISSKLAYGGYTWFILGNISSAVVNLSQIPLVTYGLLAGEFGHAKAISAITQGFKNYFKFHQDDNTRLTAFGMPLADRTAFGGSFIDESTPEGKEMKTLFDAALANGIVRRTTSQELQEAKFNRIDSVTGNMVRAEMALGYVFQNSERANREVSLLAAYKLAKEKYGNKKISKDSDVTVAMERAFELVEQANGPALAEAGPQLFQTGPGKVIGTFKRFALSQLYLQYKLLRDITRPLKDDPKIPEDLKGKVPSARTLAIRQFRSIIIPAWLFAGAKGLPFYGAAEVAANLTDLLIPGDDEDDLGLDFNMTVRKAMGDVAFRGPISHFTNLDFASRTGFYGLMYRDDPYRRAEVGDLTYFGESLLGPVYAAFIRNPSKAIDKFREGDLYGAVQSASPSFIRNILKAGSLATEGALNSKGVPIVEDINGYNVMMQLFGFTPTDLSNAYQANEILSRQGRKIASRRSKLLLELNMAKNAGDIDGELSILDDINSFNDTKLVVDTQQQINSTTVKRSYDAFVDYVTGSVRGLRVNEKMRPGLIEQTGIEDPEDM